MNIFNYKYLDEFLRKLFGLEFIMKGVPIDVILNHKCKFKDTLYVDLSFRWISLLLDQAFVGRVEQ